MRSVTILLAIAILMPACIDAEDAPSRAEGEVKIDVAALTLAGITDACYALATYNGDPAGTGEPVWSRTGLCADDFGDGTGAISWVGPCDASVGGDNYVTLVLEGLYEGGSTTAIEVSEYHNPCPANDPCVRSVPCVENEDRLVEFNITVMRDADQGFFDVAVNFEDIFCSAKFDCVDELLHDPVSHERGPTGVLGFACSSGVGEPTWLHLDPVTITCTGGVTPVDPSPGACGDGATWSDDDFDHPTTTWLDGYVSSGVNAAFSSGVVTSEAVAGGGNTGPDPDPYLEMEVVHRGTSNVHTYALYPLAVWDPSSQGSISAVSATVDARIEDLYGVHYTVNGTHRPVGAGNGGNIQLAMEQGGVIYAPSMGFLCGAGVDCYDWQTKSAVWDVATFGAGVLSNPINAAGPPLNTVDGGPITFGVLIGVSDGAGGWDFFYKWQVDNWSVTVESDCVEGEPGNADPVPPGTYQTAVYWGVEEFGAFDKCYWNVALGLDLTGLGANCVLETIGTASHEPFPGGLSPSGWVWPYVKWRVDLTDQAGNLQCGQHQLNVAGSGVTTEYTTASTPLALSSSRLCE